MPLNSPDEVCALLALLVGAWTTLRLDRALRDPITERKSPPPPQADLRAAYRKWQRRPESRSVAIMGCTFDKLVNRSGFHEDCVPVLTYRERREGGKWR